MNLTLPVQAIVDRLGRKELDLKKAGAFAEAAGVRDAITVVLRMSDEAIEPPIEPSSDPI